MKAVGIQLKTLIFMGLLVFINGCSGDDSIVIDDTSGNMPPTVSTIGISGNSEHGAVLTVTYTYADAENDLERDSRTQWYRADDVAGTNSMKIAAATKTTYTLKAADIGSYLRVEVTPIATTGTLEGDPVAGSYTEQVTAEERPVFAEKNYNKVIAGFYPSWKAGLLPINAIKWDKLTHLIYSFALPENDGDLNVDELSKTSDFVSTAHDNGVNAFFSVGGATGSEGFIALSANETLRRKFVEQVEEYAYVNNYDGVDIDWEGWSSLGTSNTNETRGLLNLLKELKSALSRHGITMCMDVFPTDWGGKHYTSEMFNYVDWVNIMAYDFEGGWSTAPAHHSSLANANQALEYWGTTRGLPEEKTVLGVAFYGKEFTQPTNINASTVFNVPYRDILANDPEAHLRDQIGNTYYTGIQTMKEKAILLTNDAYLGAMIWEIAHDTPDDTKSLLTALDAVLNQ